MSPFIQHLSHRVRSSLYPPRGNPETYGAEFPETVRAFRSFLKRVEAAPISAPRRQVGIVIMPYVKTPVPWYALAFAIGLAQRGAQITVLWNDVPFPQPNEAVALQNNAIREILTALPHSFRVVRLQELDTKPLSPQDNQHIEQLAKQNLIWILRGAEPNAHHALLEAQIKTSLGETLARAHKLFETHAFDYILNPGGIIGGSSMFLYAGQNAGTRVASFDANFGVVQIASAGIAAQQTDIPLAFMQALAWSPATRAHAVEIAKREFELRRRGQDRAQYQVTPATNVAPLTADVLIPLNVEYDSAALGRHLVFANTREWISHTVQFILNNSRATIVVRQHPAERRKRERADFDVSSILLENFGENPRVRYIAAEQEINSYDLLASASLVLPYASTIGYEAAALGKPVLVAGASCYSDLGFVWKPQSRLDYFELLARGLRQELAPRPNQVEHAWLCYYLTPVCARVWTDFTPQPPDFWKWVRRSPREIFGSEQVQDMLSAIDENIPLALVRHARRDHSTP